MEDRTYGVSAGIVRGDDIKMTVEESRVLELNRKINNDSKNLLKLLAPIIISVNEIDFSLSVSDISAMLVELKADFEILCEKNYNSVEDILYLLNIVMNHLKSLESNAFLNVYLKSNKYYIDIKNLSSKLISYYLIRYFDSKGIKLNSSDIFRLKQIDFNLIGSLISE